jgi:hypothetical protein
VGRVEAELLLQIEIGSRQIETGTWARSRCTESNKHTIDETSDRKDSSQQTSDTGSGMWDQSARVVVLG